MIHTHRGEIADADISNIRIRIRIRIMRLSLLGIRIRIIRLLSASAWLLNVVIIRYLRMR